MDCPLIVVAGPASSGKKSLVRALLHLNDLAVGAEPNETISVSETSGGAGAGSDHLFPFTMTTKYYSAELAFRILPSSEYITPGEVTSAGMEGAEALIVVLDGTQEVVMGAAERWASIGSDAGVGCSIVALNKSDLPVHGAAGGAGAGAASASAAGAAVVEALGAWCLDSGLELVPTTATRPRDGFAGREKASVARVLEALQSNMWSNLQRVSAPKAFGGAAGGARGGAGAAAGGAGAPPSSVSAAGSSSASAAATRATAVTEDEALAAQRAAAAAALEKRGGFLAPELLAAETGKPHGSRSRTGSQDDTGKPHGSRSRTGSQDDSLLSSAGSGAGSGAGAGAGAGSASAAAVAGVREGASKPLAAAGAGLEADLRPLSDIAAEGLEGLEGLDDPDLGGSGALGFSALHDRHDDAVAHHDDALLDDAERALRRAMAIGGEAALSAERAEGDAVEAATASTAPVSVVDATSEGAGSSVSAKPSEAAASSSAASTATADAPTAASATAASGKSGVSGAGAGAGKAAAAATSKAAAAAAGGKGGKAAGKGASAGPAPGRDVDTDFMSMVSEVKRVRDAAKGGAMSDAQRREAAELVTMRLMAMLGGLGGAGDDDDDDDEEA